MAFDVDAFLANNGGMASTSDGLPTEADITAPGSSGAFDVDSFLKTTQDNAHLPNPAEPESGYGDLLSKASTNAKLGLMQAIGGQMQMLGNAPQSAIQELAKPQPSLPANPTFKDYLSNYVSYPASQALAKGELAATAIPAAVAPDFFDMLGQSGKQIQQEASSQQQENQPNVASGTFKGKVGNATQMAEEMVPVLIAAGVAPESIPALFGAQGIGSTYAEQTNAGRTGGEALLPSVISGAANMAFGDLPLGILTAEGGSLPAKLLKAGIAGEVTSQGLNAVQQGINKGTIDPNMTWEQYKQTAKDIGGIGATLGVAGGSLAHPFSKGVESGTFKPAEPIPESGAPRTPEQNPDLTTQRPQQNYNPETGRFEDVGAPTANSGGFSERMLPTIAPEIFSPQDNVNIPLRAVNSDPSVIYQPTNERLQSVAGRQVSGNIANNFEQQSQFPLLDYSSTGNQNIDAARELRKQSLDNVLSQIKDATVPKNVDDTKAITTANTNFTKAVNDYHLNNNMVEKLKSQIPINEQPIIMGKESDIDTFKNTFNALANKDVTGLNTNVVHDMIDNGYVKINNSGHPEITPIGKRLHTELNNAPQPVTQELPISAISHDQNRVGAVENAPDETMAAKAQALEAAHQYEPFFEKGVSLPEVRATERLPITARLESEPITKPSSESVLPSILDNEKELVSQHLNSKDNIDNVIVDARMRLNQLADKRGTGIGANSSEILHDLRLIKMQDQFSNPAKGLPALAKYLSLAESYKTTRPEIFEGKNYSVTPSDKFIAQKDQLKSKVTDIIKKINPSVDVNLVDKMFGEGEALKASGSKTAERQEVAGAYDKLNNVIHASLNTEKWNPLDTAFHEGYHAVRDMVTPSDDAVLKKAFPGTENLSQSEHEAVEFGRFMTEKNATGFAPAIRRIFSSIRQALRDIGRTLKLGKFNSTEDIFNRAERGSVYKDYQEALKSGDVEALQRLTSGNGTQYKADGNKFTEAFKKWFGDSKVVDDKGEPLTVYHGAPDVRGIFNEGFKNSGSRGEVFFASDSYNVADTYADDRRALDYQNSEPQTIPLHLSIKNPMIIDAKGKTWKETERFVKKAREAGHDGLIIKNSVDEYNNTNGSRKSTVYAYFNSGQAKSAITDQLLSRVDKKPIKGAVANNGNYDPKDPRISYKAREENLTPQQQEDAIKEASPTLHDVVYSKTPISDKDAESLKALNIEKNGTPTEKAQTMGNEVYGKLGEAVNKGLDTVESAKEKVLRSGLDLVRPVIGEKTYKQAQRRVEASIAKTKRNGGGFNLARTTSDVAHIIIASNDGHGRAIADRTGSKTVEHIMDILHPDPGRDKGLGRTYHEEIAHFVNKTLSHIAKQLHDVHEPAEKEQIRDYMVHPENLTPDIIKTQNGEIASQLARTVQDMVDHLKASGYDIPQTEGFYPRIYDNNNVVNNEAEFKADARKAYYDTYKADFDNYKTDADVRIALDDMVNRWYNNILLQDDGITNDPNGYFKNVSTVPDAPSSFRQRVLSKAADDILSKWMIKDPLSALSKLTIQTGRKAGWEKFFGGGKLEQMHRGMIEDGLTGNDISHVMNIIRSNTGQLGGDIHRSVKNALALSRYWTAVRFLTKAPFKHLSISINAGVHTGNPVNAWRTLVDSTRSLFNTDSIQATKIFAELAGITGESAEHAMLLNQSGMMSDNEKINFMSNAYYDAVGMTKLVGSHKVGMQRSIQYMLSDLADDIVNRKNGFRSAEFFVKNYGIPEGEVQNFANWVKGNGGRDIDKSSVLGNSKYADMYLAASQRATDQIISNPTGATRQMYAQHPLASLIYQLSAYHMTAMKNSLQRNARLFAEGTKAGKDYDLRDRLRFMAPMTMYIPAMTLFMYGYDKAKDAVFPPDREDKTNHLAKAFVEADLFAQFNGLAEDIVGSKYMQKKLGYYYHNWDERKSIGEKIYDKLGPDFSMFKDYAKMIGNVSDTVGNSQTKKGNEVKALYNNVVAPIATSAVATYVPFALPAFAAIQAINHPTVRRALTGAKQP